MNQLFFEKLVVMQSRNFLSFMEPKLHYCVCKSLPSLVIHSKKY